MPRRQPSSSLDSPTTINPMGLYYIRTQNMYIYYVIWHLDHGTWEHYRNNESLVVVWLVSMANL